MPMHAIERAEYIMTQLNKNKVVMVADLSREMNVTEETVRKDLEKLEKQERLIRVHGGAYLHEGFGNEIPVEVRSKIMNREKELLAARCMELIREKESVFLDSSTTAWHLARHLAAAEKRLTVITNSLAAATEVAGNASIRLILLGGELNRDTGSFEGQSVLAVLKECYVEKAFISSTGISLDAGITDSVRAEAEIRRQVMKQAKTCVMVMDSTKIGRNSIYVVGALADMDYLVVDQPLEHLNLAVQKQMTALQIPVLNCAKLQ